MKLDTLEHFLGKEQGFWSREDIDKIIGKYGKRAVFYDTEGISNKLLLLFKYRDMSDNDTVISDFIMNKNKEYLYIIKYIMEYIDHIEFVFWPSETALQIVYKILCERILSDDNLKDYSEEYIKLKQLAHKISLIRYDWYLKSKKDNKNKEDSNENK